VTRATTKAEDHDSLDDAGFERARADGAFAFWWPAHGLRYGILHSVEDDIRAGLTVICNVSCGVVADLTIDNSGAPQAAVRHLIAAIKA
jgi:ribose 1,5-bisphosphokinase